MMGPGGLSSKHGPALDLPGRFLALAMVMLAAVAILSPWSYRLLVDGFYAPRLLAFVHLNTLGVIAAVLMGASYQLIPVVLQTPLRSVRIGRLSFWLYVSGIALFLPGILETWRPGLTLGAALAFSGLLIYLVIVAATLRQAPAHDVISWHIAIALIGLAGGIGAGFLLALNKGDGFLGAATFRIVAAHATLMLAGWVVIMLNGVAYRLVGMFTLSEDLFQPRVAWAELASAAAGAWILAAGLLMETPGWFLGIGALLIASGQVLFGIQLVHLYRGRRRRGFDIHIPYALTAVASGITGSVILAAGIFNGQPIDSELWVAVGWLAISGVAITAIQGFFYKISTFLVWLHSYAPLAGRHRVPRLEELYDRRIAKTGWGFWVAALTSSVVAILTSNQFLATMAGIAALVGLGCFLVNVVRIAAHARPAATANYQHVARAPVPRAGKEGNVS